MTVTDAEDDGDGDGDELRYAMEHSKRESKVSVI